MENKLVFANGSPQFFCSCLPLRAFVSTTININTWLKDQFSVSCDSSVWFEHSTILMLQCFHGTNLAQLLVKQFSFCRIMWEDLRLPWVMLSALCVSYFYFFFLVLSQLSHHVLQFPLRLCLLFFYTLVRFTLRFHWCGTRFIPVSVFWRYMHSSACN